MPLNTQILRNGKALSIRWGGFHVAAMALASAFDSGEGPLADITKIYAVEPALFDCYPDAPFPISRSIEFHLTSYSALAQTPLNNGSYTLQYKHQFRDMEDGEIFVLLPGDTLVAFR